MYSATEKNRVYELTRSGRVLRTPRGMEVTTRCNALAERLVAHLSTFGEDPSNAQSIVAFHYPFLDFFSREPHEPLLESVLAGLDRSYDWTLTCPSASPETTMKWMALFGLGQRQREDAEKWVRSTNRGQLCATSVVGRVLESVNIAYVVARMKRGDMKAYAKAVASVYCCYDSGDLYAILDNFRFYYDLDSQAVPPLGESEFASAK